MVIRTVIVSFCNNHTKMQSMNIICYGACSCYSALEGKT